MEKTRQFGFDNVRFFLIFFVVFGHFLELSGTQGTLYLIIYTFHMPVFLFLSGYFSRFSPRKLLRTGLIYLLFQALYQIFGCLSEGKSVTVQFLRPDWVLWYLPVLMYCHLLLPVLDRLPRFPAAAVSIGIALIVGFCDGIGYGLSASRFFVFCPYFILGYRARQHRQSVEAAVSRVPKAAVPALLTANLTICMLLISAGGIHARILYGSYPYSIGYGPLIRLLLYGLGLSWTVLFLILAQSTLNRPIPLVSSIGRNTLPIYLLHGFFVKLTDKLAAPADPPGILSSLVLSVLLLMLLGSKWTGRAFSSRS